MSQSEGSLESAGWGEARGEHLPLLMLVALCAATWLALDAYLGPRFEAELTYGRTYLGLIQFFWLPLPLALAGIRFKLRDPAGGLLPGREGWVAAWAVFKQRYLHPSRVAGAFLAGALLALTINGFGSWKRSIPAVAPFAWDERFDGLDRALHGGRLPWEWLQPAFGNLPATVALDGIYILWHLLFGVVAAWQVWSADRGLRARFLLATVLVWVLLGNVAATIFSSAGPCWFGLVVPGAADPYAPLMAFLRGVHAEWPLVALQAQDHLWNSYVTHTATPYTGISAMPSVHVAMPLLYVLVAWRRSRLLGLLFLAYAAAILLGSVHLGWHYAVDGYASIVAVPVIWWAAGRLTSRAAGQRGERGSANTTPPIVSAAT